MAAVLVLWVMTSRGLGRVIVLCCTWLHYKIMRSTVGALPVKKRRPCRWRMKSKGDMQRRANQKKAACASSLSSSKSVLALLVKRYWPFQFPISGSMLQEGPLVEWKVKSAKPLRNIDAKDMARRRTVSRSMALKLKAYFAHNWTLSVISVTNLHKLSRSSLLFVLKHSSFFRNEQCKTSVPS